jgi:hypothetical protein
VTSKAFLSTLCVDVSKGDLTIREDERIKINQLFVPSGGKVHPVRTTSNVMSQNGVIVVPGLSTNQPLRGYGKEPRLKARWAKRGKYRQVCAVAVHIPAGLVVSTTIISSITSTGSSRDRGTFDSHAPLEEPTLRRLYSYMLKFRTVEERVRLLFRQGRFSGNYFAAVGQEAAEVGTTIDLLPEDTIAPSHRNFVTHIMKGTPLKLMFAHICLRKDSPDQGRCARGELWICAAQHHHARIDFRCTTCDRHRCGPGQLLRTFPRFRPLLR